MRCLSCEHVEKEGGNLGQVWDGEEDAGSSFLLLEALQVRGGGHGDVFVRRDAWHFDRDVFVSFGTIEQDGCGSGSKTSQRHMQCICVIPVGACKGCVV